MKSRPTSGPVQENISPDVIRLAGFKFAYIAATNPCLPDVHQYIIWVLEVWYWPVFKGDIFDGSQNKRWILLPVSSDGRWKEGPHPWTNSLPF
ncbi:hypothetical protein C2W62_06740 [Candidatus Entotheonella serta]|nr:hypothetical protein C2W62_06740 [Candidatus Entotheonella serta]